jgi:hypothetical protein
MKNDGRPSICIISFGGMLSVALRLVITTRLGSFAVAKKLQPVEQSTFRWNLVNVSTTFFKRKCYNLQNSNQIPFSLHNIILMHFVADSIVALQIIIIISFISWYNALNILWC